jgi:hypothetical protein
MLDANELEITALKLGSEDRYGLYEIIWALNSRYPTVPEDEKLAVARQAGNLLGRGRVSLYRQRWADNDSTSPLDAVGAQRAPEDPNSWAPGDDLVTYETMSTAGGAAVPAHPADGLDARDVPLGHSAP